MKTHNKALHRTAIPLRSIAACELGRYWPTNIIIDNSVIELYILIIENVADASAFPAVVLNESDRA